MKLAPILALITLAACSTISEPRVRAALRDAGLSERMAGCMAERMADRLTVTQLRRLQSLAGVRRDMGLDEFLFRVRALKDPEIFTVTSRAGIGCAIG